MDDEFERTTGKSFEEEATDSTRAAGVLLVYIALLCLFLFGLAFYFSP